jgi:hypothetical protein
MASNLNLMGIRANWLMHILGVSKFLHHAILLLNSIRKVTATLCPQL